MTWPMVVGLLAILTMNAVDTYFVGRLGPLPLAAMGYTFPVVAFVGSLSIGLGVGANSVLSRALGGGDRQRVQRLTTDALLLGLVVVGIVATIGLLTIDPLFRLLGATDETLPLIRRYMSVWYFGSVFLIVPMVANSALRASGDARTPMVVMVVSAIVNVILDPILIFGWGPFPRLEIQGAAIATVCARAVTLVVTLWFVVHRERMVVRSRPRLRELLSSWRELLSIAVPSAASNVIIPLTAGVLTRLVAGFGEPMVAAFGVGSRIELLVAIMPMALGSGLAPVVGQNWGAARISRVVAAVRFALLLAFVWGLVSFVMLWFAAEALGRMFSDDPVVAQGVRLFLQIVPLGFAFQNMVRVATSFFNSTGRPFRATALNLLATPCLVVPLAWVAAPHLGLHGVFFAMAGASSVTGVVAFCWLRPLLRR